jgi:hypothetical protein
LFTSDPVVHVVLECRSVLNCAHARIIGALGFKNDLRYVPEALREGHDSRRRSPRTRLAKDLQCVRHGASPDRTSTSRARDRHQLRAEARRSNRYGKRRKRKVGRLAAGHGDLVSEVRGCDALISLPNLVLIVRPVLIIRATRCKSFRKHDLQRIRCGRRVMPNIRATRRKPLLECNMCLAVKMYRFFERHALTVF